MNRLSGWVFWQILTALGSTLKRININYNVSGLPPSWYTKSLVQFGFSKMAACWLLPFNLLGQCTHHSWVALGNRWSRYLKMNVLCIIYYISLTYVYNFIH